MKREPIKLAANIVFGPFHLVWFRFTQTLIFRIRLFKYLASLQAWLGTIISWHLYFLLLWLPAKTKRRNLWKKNH